MTYGIVKTDNGFAVKDFSTGRVLYTLVKLSFYTYRDAMENCRNKFYPSSYYQYLDEVIRLKELGVLTKEPDADIWENLIYGGDYRGIWDGTRQEYRNVTSMDKGAATDEEIAYVDALAATYESLMAMVRK